MGYEYILETPIPKTFLVKKTVAVETTRMVMKKGVMKKQRERKPAPSPPAEELPAPEDLVVIIDAEAPLETPKPFEPLFEDYEEEIEFEVAEKVFVEQEHDVQEQIPANVVRMADAHNDRAQNRMFTHYFVGRYVDEKWVPCEKTDGVVFSGDYYEKHKFQEMEDLDERELLLAIVDFFGWKGDLLDSPKDEDPSDDFHDSEPPE